MLRHSRLRRGAAVLAFALALSPVAARAQSPAPGSPDGRGTVGPESAVGVLMAVVCGASINVARYVPAPIVIAVAGASCIVGLLDALLTPDPKP
jgi:peptidoglycan/LPS O-acetylase OafA/YrhL